MVAGILCILITIGSPGCRQGAGTPSEHAYDDCVLGAIKGDANVAVIAAIKRSCAEKHPRTFDFAAIAGHQGAPSWPEVVDRKGYAQLTDEEKRVAESVYFKEYVEPAVHPDFVSQARHDFKTLTRQTTRMSKLAPPMSVPSEAVDTEQGVDSDTLRIAEHFGAALAGSEALWVLAQNPVCGVLFKKKPAPYQATLKELLGMAPAPVRARLAVFSDETEPTVIAMRGASHELVDETLANAVKTMRMSDQAACGFALGTLVAGAKRANEEWERSAARAISR